MSSPQRSGGNPAYYQVRANGVNTAEERFKADVEKPRTVKVITRAAHLRNESMTGGGSEIAGFDSTANVEGRQHQTVLSMAATMCWVKLRAKGIAR
jgi:hypothetical protein